MPDHCSVWLHLVINFNTLGSNYGHGFRLTMTPSSCLTSSGRDNQWETHPGENKAKLLKKNSKEATFLDHYIL